MLTYCNANNPDHGYRHVLDNNGAEKRPKSPQESQNAQSKLDLSTVDHTTLRSWVHWSPTRLAIGDVRILQGIVDDQHCAPLAP